MLRVAESSAGLNRARTRARVRSGPLLALSLWLALPVARAGELPGVSSPAGDEERADQLEQLLLSEFPRVVTAAAFREQTLEEAPSAVLVVTADDIRASGARTLGEALERCAGIDLISGEQLAIRGLGPSNRVGGAGGASRVLLLIDGVRINNVFSDSFTVGLARGAEDISRIEVMKGPGSALYGTSAFAGVVQVVTLKGSDLPGVEARVRLEGITRATVFGRVGGTRGPLESALSGRAQVHGDSTSSQRALVSEVRASLSFKGASVAAGYTFLTAPGQSGSAPPEFDDLPSGGALPPDGSDGVASRNGEGSRAIAGIGAGVDSLAHFRSAAGSPGTAGRMGKAGDPGSTAAETVDPPPEQNGTPAVPITQQHGYLAMQWERALSPGISTFARVSLTGATLSLPSEDLEELEGRLGGEGRVRLRLTPRLWTTAGLELRTEEARISHPAADLSADVLTRRVAGAYAQAEVGPFLATSLTAGIRAERSEPSINGLAPRVFQRLDPRLGLVTTLPTRTVIKAFYGQAYQAPSLSMLFYDGTARDTTILANPDLLPEQLRSVELEVGQPLPAGLQVRLNLFHDQISDLILPVIVSSEERILRFENRDVARLGGGELELTWDPGPPFQLFANATLLRAVFASSGAPLPLVAPLRFNAGVKGSPLPRVYGWLSASYVSGQAGSPGDAIPEELTLESRLRLDARVAIDLSRHWQLALSVRNLFGSQTTEFNQNQLYTTPGTEAWIELALNLPAPPRRAPDRAGEVQ